ncbi:unnamed protein product [Prunus brigantina]
MFPTKAPGYDGLPALFFQSAFVPNRMILDNVMAAFETMHTIKGVKRGRDVKMALKLDMAKAYDRVEWVFLREMMLKLGFSSIWVAKVMDCVGAPSVTHLLFSDDSLLFMKVTKEVCVALEKLFKVYEEVSGQQINYAKSAFSLSPNATNADVGMVAGVLNIPFVQCHEKYLGLPTVAGKGRKQLFQQLKDKLWKHISGWKEKLLSRAGKEVLIKAVLQAIPTYSMSCFRIPKGLCKELTGIMARFWWAKVKDKRGIHWVKWESLCKSKSAGGLGFRDLEAFNQALLAKQCWRIFRNPESLVARIFRARYHSSLDFLESGAGTNPSFIWRSLQWGKELFQKGLRWRVGNGLSIKVYTDKWIPAPSLFKIMSHPQLPLSTRVCDLFTPSGQWNVPLVKQVFWDQEVEAILQIPLVSLAHHDCLIWHYERNGLYSVRSGYRIACLEKDNTGGSTSSGIDSNSRFWKKVWVLKIPNKIKFFLWRCVWDFLPCGQTLYNRKIATTPICLFAYICWGLWNRRNKVIFEGISEPAPALLARMSVLAAEFSQATCLSRQTQDCVTMAQVSVHVWRPPPAGFYKINVDGALKSGECFRGVGVVIRNEGGEFMAACVKRIEACYGARQTELVAAIEGLRFALDMGFTDVVLEMDAQDCINGILSAAEYNGPDGLLFQEVKSLLNYFRAVFCQWTPRGGNKVAHSLAQFAISCSDFISWIEEAPIWLTPVLQADVPSFDC